MAVGTKADGRFYRRTATLSLFMNELLLDPLYPVPIYFTKG
jgi:hypothetical protein